MNINLLPRRTMWERSRYLMNSVLITLLLGVSAIAAAVTVIDQSQLTTEQQTLKSIRFQQSALLQEQNALNGKLQMYVANSQLAQSVGSQWMVQRLISEVMSILPAGTSLSTLSLNGNTLIISGNALTLLEIAQFELKLNTLRSIQSTFTQSVTSLQSSGFSFTMTVQVKGGAVLL